MGIAVTRIADALAYDAPSHFGVVGGRLPGLDAGGIENSCGIPPGEMALVSGGQSVIQWAMGWDTIAAVGVRPAQQAGNAKALAHPLTIAAQREPRCGKSCAVRMRARMPLGRPGGSADFTGPLPFLSSAASSFTTGHIRHADGGHTAG